MYRLAIYTIIIISLLGCDAGPREEAATVRMGVLPDQSFDDLQDKYQPLIDFLTLKVGVPVTLTVPDNYNHLLELFMAGEVDIAYLGGLTFVRAQQEAGARPLVSRDIDIRFTSYFLARSDNAGDDIKDFGGTVFGFGSRLSTSGHLMPRHYLNEMNVVPESFFSDVQYTGAHDKTIYMIRDGELDLGVVNSQVFGALLNQGKIKAGEIKVLWETPPYTDYVWAARPDIDPEISNKLLNAFLELSVCEPHHQEILEKLGAKAFLPSIPSDFDKLRSLASKMNLL